MILARTIFDYIYYCAYPILSKLGNKGIEHDSTEQFMALTIAIHMTCLFLFVRWVMGTFINISSDISTIIVLIICFTSIILIYYYYIKKRNGERIIAQYAGKIVNKTRIVIGCLIFIEAFVFPFIFAAIIIILDKYF